MILNISKKGLICILCSLFINFCNSQDLITSQIRYIDSIGSKYIDQPGFTVLIGKGDKILHKKAFGLANYELDVPLKTDYSFAIGSLSKQFIAIAILKLVEEGKISLDDTATKYLDWLNTKEKDHITIKHLLTHTSGIKDFFMNSDFVDYFIQPFSKEKMQEYLSKEVDFENTPGGTFKYSNGGYVYLSLIIEKVTNQSLHSYLSNTFFEPLNMNATYVGDPKILKKGAVTGYNTSRDGKKTLMKETYLFANLNWVMGAGCIYSSVEDMVKWINGLLEHKIVNEESLQLAFCPNMLNNGKTTKYGLGFEVKIKDDKKIITHSGMINGFQSNMIMIPEQKIYGIALSNRIDFAPNFIYSLVHMMNSK